MPHPFPNDKGDQSMTKHPFRFTFFLLVCLIFPLTVTAQVVSIPDPSLRAAVETALGKASGATITAADMAKLTRLEAKNANISDLTGLEAATELTSLGLRDNNISDISAVAELTNLTYLNLTSNNISDISPLAGLNNLTSLNLGYNNISDISAVARLTNLTRLDLWTNNISDISAVARLTNLTYLNLGKSSVSDISAVAGLISLTYLNLNRNSIADISPLEANTGLSSGDEVDVRGNPLNRASIKTHIPALQGRGVTVEFDNVITELVNIPDPNLRAAIETALGKASGAPITVDEMATLTYLEAPEAGIRNLTGIEHATNLRELHGWRNSVSDLSPLTFLTKLTGLYLGGSSASDISPLAGLTNLESLFLDGNGIADLSPLAGLTKLTRLALNNNSISNLSPLAGLINLKWMRIVGNNISDLSPLVTNTGLGDGDELEIRRNPLSYTSIKTHIPALQSRGVTIAFDNQAHPALLKISGDNQTGTSGAALSDPFVIEVQDANGASLAGVSVTFTVTSGGGTLNATSATTNANGRAESTLTLGPNLGKNTVEVSAAGIESSVTFYANSDLLPSNVQGTQIYWADVGKSGNPIKSIRRANIDGTEVQDLITGLGRPAAIALDIEGGKMYWTDINQNKIRRANFDGTDMQDLVTGSGRPAVIALDVEGGKMYWTDRGQDKIRRANFDGTEVQDLVTGLEHPFGIALDVEGGKMYWTDLGQNKIQCANLDGTEVQNLVTGLAAPAAIALDIEGEKIYWTETDFAQINKSQNKIRRVNLDGTNMQDLVMGLGVPLGIALDVAGGKMYWTDEATGKIQCANLDGTEVQDLVTRLFAPFGIALAIPPDLPLARADVNQDRKVNITDLLLVVSTLGNTAPALLFGDVNEDNRVTIDDVLLVIEALDDPVTAAAPSNNGRILPLEGTTLEGHLNRLRSHSDGSLKYRQAIAFFQNLLASVAPPDKTELLANYPNPFNPETWIPYRLAEDADVKLTIYDVAGAVVRRFDLGYQLAGFYTDRGKAVYWNGRNGLGEQVGTGVYFYHLSTGDYSQTRRLVILK